MTRFSFDEGTSGRKRKRSSFQEEEDSEKTCDPGEEENLEPEDLDEESDEVGDEVEDHNEMDQLSEEGCFCRSNPDGEFNFRIDPDVLDCSICYEPLHPPIFQCKSGHVACSDCCPKLLNKCHVCHQPIGRRRCIALEKVIESIKVPCQYANYGCRAILSFARKASHEETCSHAALFCPISNCFFSGSKSLLFSHAQRKHFNISKSFSYDQPFMIALEKQEPLMFLLGDDDRLFLLVNIHETCLGNALSVICMAPNNPMPELWYELRVKDRGGSLHLGASVEKVKRWSGVHSWKAFLVVPDGFSASNARLSITVSICKSPGAMM